MSIIIGVPKTAIGAAYTLTSSDVFLNFAGDTVTATGTGVDITGSNNTLTIAGHIFGNADGITVGDSAADVNNTINILAGGVVASPVDDGFQISASGTTINNAGTIAAADDGIRIIGPTGPGTTTINNSGLMTVEFWGIGHSDTETLVLTNTGTIQSANHQSFMSDGNAVDKVNNKGLMVGNIDLGSGDDVYDGRLGRVTANPTGSTVNGQAGIDKLLGGKFVDTFNGGSENDTLTGGLGIDLLTGGSEQDKFVFNAVAEGGDIISDFAVVDDTIVVKSSAFGGLAKGALSAAAFFSSAAGVAHDANDRFIYETDVDKLWYDSNGNAAGGRVLLADLNDVNFTRFDILVV